VFGDVNVVSGKLSASITFKRVMHAQEPVVRPDKGATIVN
jgi:hypothetical protein